MGEDNINGSLNEAIRKLEELNKRTHDIIQDINNGEITKKTDRAVRIHMIINEFKMIDENYQDLKSNSLTRELYLEFLNSTWDTIKNIPEIVK